MPCGTGSPRAAVHLDETECHVESGATRATLRSRCHEVPCRRCPRLRPRLRVVSRAPLDWAPDLRSLHAVLGQDAPALPSSPWAPGLRSPCSFGPGHPCPSLFTSASRFTRALEQRVRRKERLAALMTGRWIDDSGRGQRQRARHDCSITERHAHRGDDFVASHPRGPCRGEATCPLRACASVLREVQAKGS